MRDQYIQLVKEYISKRPDYKDTLQEIKATALTFGATEEEFQQALMQLGIPQGVTQTLTSGANTNVPNETPTPLQKPTFTNRLLELDIATHIAILCIAIVGLAIFVVLSVRNNGLKNEATTQVVSKHETNTSYGVGKVYASTKIIDAQKTFSFPPSNITLRITGTPKKEVFGFFPYWMLEMHEKVNTDAITTVSLFGLEVDGKGNIITHNHDGLEDGGWKMWNDPKLDAFIARVRQKGSKVHLTLKSFNNRNIENLVLSDTNHAALISNALQFVNAKNLDGITIDFEYTGIPDPKVTLGFTRLVANLSSELKRQIPNAKLTIATHITAAAIPGLCDISQLANYADALIIMGYDMHTPKGVPGPIAPMDGSGSSIIGSLQSYLEKVSPDKLILALGYYGYAWQVSDTQNPTTGQEAMILPYAEIAHQSKNTAIAWNHIAQTPWYRFFDQESGSTREVHFENTRSLAAKYDYINKKGLQGVGIWAIGYDGLNTDLQQLLVEKFAK